MGDHNFIKIKNDILDFIKTQASFKECFVVRNIFSRFAVYIVAPKDFEQFENAINERFSDCIDLIQVISKQDDSFIYDDLKNTSTPVSDTSDTVFFSERHTENTNWFIKEQYKLATSVTSFYSFKGGVGRTTATILTALLLARAGKKVLVIDFDLEAPGLASVFANQDDDTEDLLKVKGFVDFIIDFDVNKRDFEKINLDNYYFVRNEQTLVGTKGGEIVIVPAIATDSANASAYIDKLSKANIKFEKNRDYIPDIFLKKMEDKIKPDFILIDTRTGINDVGGLVFNRYAQNIFLIFYGNKQNMFGLESILPELKKLNEEKNVQFYLVNSPVPKNPTDERAEVDFFVESSYDLFCQYFYDIDRLPSQFDESEVHFPIPIHFNDQALILNNFKKIASIIESPNNEYLKIANIILNSKEDDTIKQVSTKSENESNKELLDSIVKIDKGFGASELEYQDENDLTKYFYPRKDYKYIFDKSKFLILGDKGVGKTALFSVLSHTNYAKALSKFCGVDAKEIDNTTWVIGLDKDKPEFPNKTNFESLTDCSIPELRNYWIVLLLRQVIKLDNTLVSNSPLVEDIIGNKIKNLKDIAKRSNIGEDLFEILKEFNQNLKTKGATYIFVYDHLDAVLPSEGDLRGKLASALLSLFYDNINTLSHIKAKIFLRNDIFDREVKNITDKVKVQNYSVKIQWEYNQLLNIIWKISFMY